MPATSSSITAEALRAQVSAVLATFQHSTLEQNLIELNALQQVSLLDGVLQITLQLPFAWLLGFKALKQATSAELSQLSGATQIHWSLEHNIMTLQPAQRRAPLATVKNIIAVSSGKGGVGKSSTTVNLALAFAESGVRVGILDADIYGPSLPTMLGSVGERPTSPDGKLMRPIIAHGLATHSIGYLMDEQHATVWRGPMASKALLQLLNETLWPDLDYLIIDMPPGTGDIQLTLAQNIPVTGAVVVTTPQDIALIDARKGMLMFNQVNVPVAGIIENMSYHVCNHCGAHESIFGEGGAKQLSIEQQSLLLGQIPLHRALREDSDSGMPTLIRRPDSELAEIYRQIAEQISSVLYWQGDMQAPSIAVRNL